MNLPVQASQSDPFYFILIVESTHFVCEGCQTEPTLQAAGIHAVYGAVCIKFVLTTVCVSCTTHAPPIKFRGSLSEGCFRSCLVPTTANFPSTLARPSHAQHVSKDFCLPPHPTLVGQQEIPRHLVGLTHKFTALISRSRFQHNHMNTTQHRIRVYFVDKFSFGLLLDGVYVDQDFTENCLSL